MIKRALLLIGAGVAIYLLIPRLGGLEKSLQALRHAHVWLMAVGVVVEIVSLAAYIALYRHVIRAQGRPVSFLAAGQGVMAGFLVSHVVPGGAAAGTLANIKTMEHEGIGARETGVAVTLTVIVSDIALAMLFLVGVIYSVAKGSLPIGLVVAASIAILLLGLLVATAFLFAFRRDAARTIVHTMARVLHRLIKRVDADAVSQAADDIAGQARTVLGGRRFRLALVLAMGNWLADIFVLYLFFLAVGHHQPFGALLVAYAIANLVSVIPITPSGLGVMEATLVAVSVGFGATRSVAVIAVLGYRLVNFWLPLPVGLAAYVRARLNKPRSVTSGN